MIASGVRERGVRGAELTIQGPGKKSLRVPLEQARYALGRTARNELCFPDDDHLSREHLVFELQGDGWTVRDLGSRNGTRVNGNPVSEPVGLVSGDRITAGHLSIRYTAQPGIPDRTEILFINETQTGTGMSGAVSVDLKSAMKPGAELGSRAGLEHRHLEALVRAGRELAGHCELEKLFELILDLSMDAVEASRGVLMTLESDRSLHVRAIRGEGLSISTTVRDRVVGMGESLLVRDASLDGAFAGQQSILVQKIRSFLAVPLQTEERVTGLVYLDSPDLIRDFTVRDLSLLTVMANIAAVRIEHARLIEVEEAKKLLARELERAAEIQGRLLPAAAPDIPGLQLAGYNAACRTVGGDYYDFLPLPDGRVVVLVGDVSGKGMGAALLMSSLQARVHALFEEPQELAPQVTRLNRSIASNCPGNCFITFFIAVLDPQTGQVQYCNAGHNAPILVHAQANQVETLGSTGMVLGIVPKGTYEQSTCHLEHGDLLVLFSDGVTEACGPDGTEEFGETRLAELVQRERQQTAGQLLETIKAEVKSFTGGAPAADDITIVIARRT
jgi:sigma-B regulation protein RsbU (phosphoserine phosphatase)